MLINPASVNPKKIALSKLVTFLASLNSHKSVRNFEFIKS